MIEQASRFQLPPGPWHTLLDGLDACFPAIGRACWQGRLLRGRVLDVAGQPLAVDTPYRVGMQIAYFREVVDEAPIPFDETIIHVDEDLVVVDKPHFLPVMPAGRFVVQTLLHRLIATLDNRDLVPLHRLDRLTAGVVMFSARPATRAAYEALFRERRLDKRYEAVAPPLPALALPLRHASRLVPGEPFFRMREEPGPANSYTDIDVLAQGRDHWHYELRPKNGRKHQLRVQMAGLGAAIRNDPWYPDLLADHDDYARPLQLLARSLAFDDPLTGAPRQFRSCRNLSMLPSG